MEVVGTMVLRYHLGVIWYVLRGTMVLRYQLGVIELRTTTVLVGTVVNEWS